jgi:protein involved in polysaccharide export with SLBB domain
LNARRESVSVVVMLLRSLLVVVVSVVLSLDAGAQSKSPAGEVRRTGKKAPAGKVEKKAPPEIKAADNIVIELLHPEFDAPNVSSTYTVSGRGTIKMPRIEHEIVVKRLTCEELTKVLEGAYREAGIYEEPVFRTALATGISCGKGLPHVVSVGGAVKKPTGSMPQHDGMRMMQAIIAAGGFSELADVKHVKLIRGTKETVYDLERMSNDNSDNPVLKDGDTVHVPELKKRKPASDPPALDAASGDAEKSR